MNMGPNEAGTPESADEPAAQTAEAREQPAVPEQARRIVVAAVIERDGLFLAARRTEPPALAGRWEFPGGKVEPGESEAEALVRECREELGVLVAVGPAVGPEYTVGSLTVHTYRAELLSGEPQPVECHDALRWLRPGESAVRELPWLDGDYVILDALEHSAG
ncbi:MAG TPA: (deoxy)nucleoside triphosphate pyrophosphohydrolase [Actinocrinis sp.]|nr:(deoxy)nucleoside triphosphate pyrophosphohydrolase [Actinocrinis sp.]